MQKKLIVMLAATALLGAPLAMAKDEPKPAAKAEDTTPAPSYALVREKSSLKFIATQNGAPVEGTFKDFDTKILFDQEHPEKIRISAVVKTGSVTSSNADVESNLKLPEWLSADAFPTATFTVDKVARMPSSNSFYGDGELTIRGVKKPATINFLMEYPSQARAIATGSITVHRKDYGVGQGQWQDEGVIKDLVRVEFRIVADKQ